MHVVTVKEMAWTLDPNFWHFLQKDGAYYLWVNCEQSFVGYTVLVQLSADEYREYHGLGLSFLRYLAERINYWPSDYVNRRIEGAVKEEASQAISDWITAGRPSAA